MTRPLRINFDNAVYHVMNRGRDRQRIFHGKPFIQTFLQCLEDTHQLFDLDILAYCLMSNHYHLLVRTPKGNISRCMRHINGIYTQRYNKLRNTDGSLFRGRYKSILVDADNYLLQVSRYIHRNPIDTKIPMVETLKNYPHSSYPAYLDDKIRPTWLNTQTIMGNFADDETLNNYANYVNQHNERPLTKFYKNKPSAILGSTDFIEQFEPLMQITNSEISTQQYSRKTTCLQIIEAVSTFYDIPTTKLVARSRGPKNLPRLLAMYFCRTISKEKLWKIAAHFNVKHYSTVSHGIKQLEQRLATDSTLQHEINTLHSHITR